MADQNNHSDTYYNVFLKDDPSYIKSHIEIRQKNLKTDKKIIAEIIKQNWYKKEKRFLSFLYSDSKYIDSSNFPNYPVDSEELVQKVTKQYLQNNDELPTNTPALVTELCKGFNQVIHLNKTNQPIKNLVYSAQTGSAKSLSATMYVSMLQDESSIIVVPRIDQAIEIAKNINEWSNNPDYCRCFYRVSQINSHHPLRIDKQEIGKFRCIIMTHAMFIKVNEEDKAHKFHYQNKKRDLVIIDERIILNKTFAVTTFQIEELIKFLNWYYSDNIKSTFQYILNYLLKTSIEHDKELQLYKAHYDYSENVVFLNNEEVIKELKYLHKKFSENNLLNENTKLFLTEELLLKKKIIHIIQSIIAILENEYIYLKLGNNKTFLTVKPVSNQFGSTITLDATAEINKYYDLANRYNNGGIELVQTTRTKQYNNVHFHIADYFGQGRSSITKNSTYEKETPKYIKLIDGLLKNEQDKILIVTHKKFKTYLEHYRENNNKKIFFTHWGNHIGKNDWKECNKIIIIGWNFYPKSEYYASGLKAIANVEDYFHCHENPIINYQLQVTQIADDLVQAINRISIRKTIDKDGNCPISDVYLFRSNNQLYDDVFDILKFIFPEAKFSKWQPNLKREPAPKRKTEKKADRLLSVILDELRNNNQIIRSKAVEISTIPISTASRIMNTDYFKKQLDENNVELQQIDHKTSVFKFKECLY